MNGSDEPENIVNLTPEEHYVAHQLLIKMHPGNSAIVFAAYMMTVGRIGNKLYGWLRKKHSRTMAKQRLGKGNGSFGTRWICNIDLQENKKISKDDQIPKGWIAGRNKWKTDSKVFNTCTVCGKAFYAPRKRKTCSEDCYKKSLRKKRKSLSLEHKDKISAANLGHKRQTGSKNSCYHKKFKWINDGTVNKKFTGDQIPKGWIAGRMHWKH